MLKETSLTALATMALIGLVSWNVLTTQRLSVEVAVLSNKVEFAASDRFTSVEAQALQSGLETRIERLEQWNQNLSNRLADVEQHLRELENTD